jgi:CRP/FNR family transcriptional regulator, cyclic AMP receptor protein
MTSSLARDFDAPSASPPAAALPTTDGRREALRSARRPLRDGAQVASPADLTIRIGGTPNTVSVLEVDPDLGRGIEPDDWEAACRATRATLARIGRRECTSLAGVSENGNIVGLVVNHGVISREIALGEHVAFELLTAGDVLPLAASEPDDLDFGGRVTLTALEPAELIVLSKPFIHAAARWPSLLNNLHRRLEAQRQRLAIQGLAAHLPRAEDRLLLILWILADRCGRVTPEGIVLPLSLSHEVLGRLAAARRPTITLALRTLEGTDCVQRGPNGYLTLGSAARQKVEELTHASISRPPIGPSVALHPPPRVAARRPLQST